jgi:hypothetical protein
MILETLRIWVRRSEIEASEWEPPSRIRKQAKDLKREVKKLKRAN